MNATIGIGIKEEIYERRFSSLRCQQYVIHTKKTVRQGGETAVKYNHAVKLLKVFRLFMVSSIQLDIDAL